MERPADITSGETTADPFVSIAEFLEEASAAIGGNPIVARTCIARAAMLLREVQARHAPAGDSPQRSSGPGLARWKLNRVLLHVERRLGGNLRVRDLARLTGLSPGHFARAFHQSVGVAPRHFLIERRIERAKTLMQTSDMTLSEIALACGLSDQAHLSRLFRRHTGTTPNAWRREWRGADPQGPSFVTSPRLAGDGIRRNADAHAG
ncbi:AraC family transcriptional regulator [Rhodopseudomonas sp. AAP120]|uniref:helix-turn-helix domain-containing protein n=1 Tax=Rhodopseudomonas sp. AAP120 TaxID=1523430 RepID=UPI0009EA91A3|nr:AraC family transcriptional regulator [Rhodopseudomonas sp. AAP120]